MRCVFRVLCSKRNNNQLILFNLYGCAVSSHHQHTATTSNCLIIQINTYHGISSHLSCLCLHFLQRCIFCHTQHFFIRTGTTTHNIPNTCKQVAEYIGTYDCFSGNYSIIFHYSFSPSMMGVVVISIVFSLLVICKLYVFS